MKFFKHLIGFLIFVIFLLIATSIFSNSDNIILVSILTFMIQNLALTILITSISILADIFWELEYPIKLIAPIINAVSGILIVYYIYKLFLLLEDLTHSGINIPITLIYFIVVISVLASGYIKIFSKPKIKPKVKHKK